MQPLANIDYTTTLQNNPVTIPVKANDRCQNGPTCTLSSPLIVTGSTVSGASQTVNPDGTITYQPAPGFVGIDSFRYKVCDNQVPVSKCDSEWVYVNVLPLGGPNTTQASDDYAQLTSINTVSGNVAINDNDPEGHIQTVTPQTTTVAGKGTLVLLSDGTYTFTPVSGFVGAVDFVYTICDNANPQVCAMATLHIFNLPCDITPNISIVPNVMHGITSFNATVKITELNQVNTNGLISVRIPKDTRVSFTFNNTATMIGFTQVSNASWTYNGSNPFYHIFTTSSVITAGSFSTFGFVASFNPLNTDGTYTMTSTIASGSGTENRTTNNSDSEKADYFHN
jgi:hypothetical protein